MSVEGDARSARQSSSSAAPRLGLLRRVYLWGPFTFAGFVLVHVALQAFRATRDAARPEPGLESQRYFVALVLLAVWLPFALHAGKQLRSWLSRARPVAIEPRARALGFAERLALLVVIGFTLGHAAEMAWPLLAGEMAAAEVRPELVLALSSTSHGVPIHAALYICGVAAAAFYATRQVLVVKGAALRPVARAIVGLGVLAYALGSFAVIRCSGGQLFP